MQQMKSQIFDFESWRDSLGGILKFIFPGFKTRFFDNINQ